MTTWKVWTRTPRYFETLAEARAYAAAHCARTGIVVAITAVPGRKTWGAAVLKAGAL